MLYNEFIEGTGYWNLIEKIHEARNSKEVER